MSSIFCFTHCSPSQGVNAFILETPSTSWGACSNGEPAVQNKTRHWRAVSRRNACRDHTHCRQASLRTVPQMRIQYSSVFGQHCPCRWSYCSGHRLISMHYQFAISPAQTGPEGRYGLSRQVQIIVIRDVHNSTPEHHIPKHCIHDGTKHCSDSPPTWSLL